VSNAVRYTPQGGKIDLAWRLRDGFGDFALFVLGEDLIAECDALITNVDRRPGDELPDGILGFAAERAAEMLVVRHRLPSMGRRPERRK
jgi:hypothetical protein